MAGDFSGVALVGPTAVGKTELSLLLAERLDAEIVSLDSMLVYQGMDIGTAKPTPAERRRIPHHLVDVVPPSVTYSVGRYRRDAERAMNEIRSRGRSVLFVGGTGLYLRALNRGLFNAPPADPVIRRRLRGEAREKGTGALYGVLRGIDPSAAKKIAPGDLRRIVRALEVFELTGVPISELQTRETHAPSQRLAIVALDRPREHLYQRIDRRVDAMMEAGLLDEVQQLRRRFELARGPRQALGYKELLAYLDGNDSLEDAVELIKVRTRRFAKRQLTWFRAEPGTHWVSIERDLRPAEILPRIEYRLANLHDYGYP